MSRGMSEEARRDIDESAFAMQRFNAMLAYALTSTRQLLSVMPITCVKAFNIGRFLNFF
jgi:hypothetical protein